ncbi:AraC family transcriptional regulator [Rhizobiaceae bacterium n13]|uniref:AraC family transcriptional regulator n=1 Tax=Ferirhizobium litorale TaxID=2927786 RepID=A0AAE3U1Q0_9HYPH|nr:AraC family transcriptional regulator [Fererhizobium litorale]MDI7860368.1 AraC family transcriptional regulator [Fererhizobium litorale]MDI7920503.1 AraC family transcriptional regulator [Fererhizobium litorale]
MGNSVLDRLIASGPFMKTVTLPHGRQRLHTMPTSTGYEIRTQPSYDWDGRKRGQTPFTVLQHTLDGAGNLRFEGRSYRLLPGETLLLLVPHDHRYWLEEGGRWSFFWLSMNGEEAIRLHRAVLANAGPVLRLKPATIEHLAACSLQLAEAEGVAPGRASAIAYDAAMALYDDVFGGQTLDGVEESAMRRVVHHIERNLDRPLPVAELARISGFSRSHFSRLFMRAEGMPPAEFVLGRRIARATALLTETAHVSVKEVSAVCGFDNANYFAKVFRRHFGASPTEFRTTGMYASVPATKDLP